MKWWQALLLILILLVAAALRLTGIDWDNYNHYHPDERYITWVATTIERPLDWSVALDPRSSSFNPFYWPDEAESKGIEVLQGQPRSFAYGHLPLYLGVFATRLVERFPEVLRERLPQEWLLTRDLLNGAQAVEFRHLTAVGRAMTALFDVGVVGLVFLLGCRLYGVNAGLLAAALLAINVMHIQLAHFFAVDPLLTFFVVAAVATMVAALPVGQHHEDTSRPVRSNLLLTTSAIFIGLAIGSKFSAALLFIPLIIALWMQTPFSNRRFAMQLLGFGALALATFIVTNPFALLDWTCTPETLLSQSGRWSLSSVIERSCYLQNVIRQGAMVRGSLDAPFARQYAGTLPILYYLEGQIRWGMGPALGLVSIAGLGWVSWRVGRDVLTRVRNQATEERTEARSLSGELLVLAWVMPYFLTTGFFFAKFMRYMQPITPFLMLFAAALLMRVRPLWLRSALIGVTLISTAFYAAAFVQMYRQEHPWIAASRWLFRNAPAQALILSEQWDEGLPSSLEVDGEFRSRFEYEADELTWLTGADQLDNRDKLAENLERLAGADFVVLSSNRVYGVAPRLPERYPLTSQYHQLLFDGDLGYELVYVSGRFPTIGGVRIKPDTFSWPDLEPPPLVAQFLAEQSGLSLGRVDESFVVYDQPLTMIFANTGRLSAGEMEALFQTP